MATPPKSLVGFCVPCGRWGRGFSGVIGYYRYSSWARQGPARRRAPAVRSQLLGLDLSEGSSVFVPAADARLWRGLPLDPGESADVISVFASFVQRIQSSVAPTDDNCTYPRVVPLDRGPTGGHGDRPPRGNGESCCHQKLLARSSRLLRTCNTVFIWPGPGIPCLLASAT